MGKFNKFKGGYVKKKQNEEEQESLILDKNGSSSDSSSDEEVGKNVQTPETIVKNSLWVNRERVLIFCSRGTDFRIRHLMNDLRSLMPHTKSESKLEKSMSMRMINEMAEMKNCSKVLYFENRKRKDNYLWMSNTEEGPSIKFLVHNIHTMMEMKMSGNCLKASRPIISFDSTFDDAPHLTIIKNILTQIFATPNHHPRSQPFIDHVFSFSVSDDGKIWFRNFQIVDETLQLQEIGPRFVLELIRIFDGSFEGAVLYDNPDFESPNLKRRMIKLAAQNKYANKKLNEKMQKAKEVEVKEALKEHVEDPAGEIFSHDIEMNEEMKTLADKIDFGSAKKRKMEETTGNKKPKFAGHKKTKVPKY